MSYQRHDLYSEDNQTALQVWMHHSGSKMTNVGRKKLGEKKSLKL
jgi:hypothetical protein